MTPNMPEWFIKSCQMCRSCLLHRMRHCVVVGRGNRPATILYIGEAPGVSEDLLGLPFIGSSGKLFDAMRVDAEIDYYSCYITNTVMCRPTDRIDGENRLPFKEEMEACLPKVMGIVKLVQPKAVVFVGDVARKFLCKKFAYEYGKKLKLFSIPHPAYVLRSGGRGSPLYLHSVRILNDIKLELQLGGIDG